MAGLRYVGQGVDARMSNVDECKLSQLLAFVAAGARVCPRPMEWQTLWESLPGARRTNAGFEPPAPLVLAGWWSTTNADKAARLVEHIRWAAERGAITETDAFLRGLPEVAWHHSDPRKPNY